MAISPTVRLGSFDTLPVAGTRRRDGERDGRGIRQGTCASGRWAALELHASQAATAMGVAYGEQVADMIQPFWVLPVVAVAGISIRRVMGFTVMSFVLGVALFGAALLIFA